MLNFKVKKVYVKVKGKCHMGTDTGWKDSVDRSRYSLTNHYSTNFILLSVEDQCAAV